MSGACECGCGQAVRSARGRFRRGHNLNAAKADDRKFWDHVQKSEGCWEWQGNTACAGYGRINLGVLRGRILAHRFSYELHRGPVPDGLLVLHTCDNRKCVNPAHLFVGTNADNMADMAAKKRAADNTGERNPNAKLTAEQVREIRRLRREGRTSRELAAAFGVSRLHVTDIVRGRSWA